MDEPLHFYWWAPEQTLWELRDSSAVRPSITAVTTLLAAVWEQNATDSQRAIMRAIEEELDQLEGSQCRQKG